MFIPKKISSILDCWKQTETAEIACINVNRIENWNKIDQKNREVMTLSEKMYKMDKRNNININHIHAT